jgi:hypothetical protein
MVIFNVSHKGFEKILALPMFNLFYVRMLKKYFKPMYLTEICTPLQQSGHH